MDVIVVSLNTESGCRPGFHEYFEDYIHRVQPDIVALQEVHKPGATSVPVIYMPEDPGKRIYPMRLHLYIELMERHQHEYHFVYGGNIYGLHDLEAAPFPVQFGQVMMVKKSSFHIGHKRIGLVYGSEGSFNTEHSGGKPCAKAAITLLLTHIKTQAKLLITNVHGFWSIHGKKDLPARYMQNFGIVSQMGSVLAAAPTTLILCVGDLNYRSDMGALEHLRAQPEFGVNGQVLNHQFGITRTRTDHYGNWQNEPEADFMIASSELAVYADDLTPHMDVPSDHALLEARFKFRVK